MWGNTTMSLSGRRGKVGLGGCESSPLKNFGIVTIIIRYPYYEVKTGNTSRLPRAARFRLE
jgi:hypothetical protein